MNDDMNTGNKEQRRELDIVSKAVKHLQDEKLRGDEFVDRRI